MRSGRVVIREERIAGREAEIYARMSARVVSALWEVNGPEPGLLARRVPVVAPRQGAFREAFTDGMNAFFYERGDVGSLASLLRRLALTPALLETAAARCQMDERFSRESFADKHVALYQKVLAARR